MFESARLSHIYLFPLLVVLNIFDIVMTNMAIAAGGRELSPFMLFFMDTFGQTLGMIVFKTPVIFMIGVLVYMVRKTKGEVITMNYGMVVCTILYMILAVWHTIGFAFYFGSL